MLTLDTIEEDALSEAASDSVKQKHAFLYLSLSTSLQSPSIRKAPI